MTKSKKFVMFGGPADGEASEVYGKLPLKLYRRGAGTVSTEYVLNPDFVSDTLAQYVPVSFLAKKEGAGEIEG